MALAQPCLRDSRSGYFDLAVGLSGLLVMAWAASQVWAGGWGVGLTLALLIGAPTIAVVSRFPMILESREAVSGIEIGFDSSVLMFLLCTMPSQEAILAWSFGVVVTQLTSGKRRASQVFNVGAGILGGGAAALMLDLMRGDDLGSPIELLAVAVAAATYFTVDYVLSAVSLTIEDENSLGTNLIQRGVLPAVGSLIAFDLLGYLGAIVVRVAPGWTVILLAVPLATLIVATRAVTRGREQSRRLGVLLNAAVRAQTLYEPAQVVEALIADARALLRLPSVAIRATSPITGEIGSQVQRGKDPAWIVAPARSRARSTTEADQKALDALAAVASDAFARLQLTDDMVHFARHDPLTDLPNRGILADRATHALQLARRNETELALLFIDLDGFKPVNDRFGHAAGDRVLVDVASRLRDCVRSCDTVARVGGDEFAVLFEDIDTVQVRPLVKRILESIADGVVVAGHQMPLSASIGVAYGQPDDSTEKLIRNADLAMYEAKARGKAGAVEYEDGMGSSRMRKLEMVDELRAAIAADEIAVYYQPVIHASTGRIQGVEALARWRLGEASIAPDVFIPLAEETGQITALGERVLQRSAEDTVAIREAGGADITMSVNISAQQLRDPCFIDVVRRALDAIGGRGLVLEVTEREGIGDDLAVHAAMREISLLGVKFAIDDFGVGFSSIGYLQGVPAQIMKADAALSRDIDSDERARVLLRSIVNMGRDLGMTVVVEGIEREAQLILVRDDAHAHFAQGYLMFRPMPLAALIEVLTTSPAHGPPASSGRTESGVPQENQALTR